MAGVGAVTTDPVKLLEARTEGYLAVCRALGVVAGSTTAGGGGGAAEKVGTTQRERHAAQLQQQHAHDAKGAQHAKAPQRPSHQQQHVHTRQ